MTTKRKLVCSICSQPITPDPISGWAGGHNAEPVNDGRCCQECNDQVVIPTRIVAIYRAERKDKP